MTQAYLRARYYDPELGRFLTEDPAKDGGNWYVYCENNPVNAIDPTGLDVWYLNKPDTNSPSKVDVSLLEKKFNEPVHLINASTAKEFIDAWNSMGTWDGVEVSITAVILNVHANPNATALYHDKEFISVSALDSKTIGTILDLGCNAGHFDHRYSSFVNKLLVKNNVDSVIASDGTVWWNSKGFFKDSKRTTYDSKGDEHWRTYNWNSTDAGKNYRDNYGFIKYTKNANGELEWEILGKYFENINNIFNAAGIYDRP